jgi:hypothetical protein
MKINKIINESIYTIPDGGMIIVEDTKISLFGGTKEYGQD